MNIYVSIVIMNLILLLGYAFYRELIKDPILDDAMWYIISALLIITGIFYVFLL